MPKLTSYFDASMAMDGKLQIALTCATRKQPKTVALYVQASVLITCIAKMQSETLAFAFL